MFRPNGNIYLSSTLYGDDLIEMTKTNTYDFRDIFGEYAGLSDFGSG